MTMTEISRLSKLGLNTLASSITFFYGHVAFILIAFIPASLRAYQMWQQLQTPIVLEIAVEATRAVLFVCMILIMTGGRIKAMRRRSYWNGVKASISAHMNQSWPSVFLAQLIVFLIFLFGLGNLLIGVLVDTTFTPILTWLDMEVEDPMAASNACLFFIKNITIIPLAMVYVLKMCGVSKHAAT